MPDIVINPQNIRISSDCAPLFQLVLAGGVIAIGDIAYQDPDDNNTLKRAQSDATEVEANALFFCLNGASTPGVDYVSVIQIDIDGRSQCTFAPGGTLVKGESYVLSPNVGKFMPIGDYVTTEYKTPLGVAISTTEWKFAPRPSGSTGV